MMDGYNLQRNTKKASRNRKLLPASILEQRWRAKWPRWMNDGWINKWWNGWLRSTNKEAEWKPKDQKYQLGTEPLQRASQNLYLRLGECNTYEENHRKQSIQVETPSFGLGTWWTLIIILYALPPTLFISFTRPLQTTSSQNQSSHMDLWMNKVQGETYGSNTHHRLHGFKR